MGSGIPRSTKRGATGVGTATTESLANIEIFCDLDAGDVAKLEKRCSWKRFGRQELIIDRQAESREVYFIASGKVRVVNYSMSGREVTFDDLVAGSHFGELADFARSLLLSTASRQRGVFDTAQVERLLQLNARGRDLDLQLWTMMSFELWCRRFLDATPHQQPAPVRPARRVAPAVVRITQTA